MRLHLESIGLLLISFASPAFLQAAQGGTLNQSNCSPALQRSLEKDWAKSAAPTPINWSQIIALIIQLMPLILALFGGGKPAAMAAEELGLWFDLPVAA